MDRRTFIKTSVVAGAGIAAWDRGLFAQTPRPNVLLIMVDQMRQPKWFPPEATLPNIDRIKSRGVEFTRHFTSAVPCSPSRACLFTGLHSDQNRIHTNVTGKRLKLQPPLDPAIPTLGHIFRSAGYATPYSGKWHLGGASRDGGQLLSAYGFEYLSSDTSSGPGRVVDGPWTQGALNWLGNPQNQSRPWFMVVSLLNPHDICGYLRSSSGKDAPSVVHELPANWDDDLKDKPKCQREFQAASAPRAWRKGAPEEWIRYLNYYYHLNLLVDGWVGKVLDALEQSGQADNTLVIFTSDHGEMAGSHRLRLKGPFVYEENTNIPLVIAYPRMFPQGAKSDALSANVDLFPTLAAMIGCDLSKDFSCLPGKNLAPAILDPAGATVSDHVLFSFTETIALKVLRQMTGRKFMPSPHNIRALREKDKVFARYFDPQKENQEFELYELASDPMEMHNLAHDPAHKLLREQMAEKLRMAEANEMSRIKGRNFSL